MRLCFPFILSLESLSSELKWHQVFALTGKSGKVEMTGIGLEPIEGFSLAGKNKTNVSQWSSADASWGHQFISRRRQGDR